MMKIPYTASILALALAVLPGTAFSQAVVQPLPGSTDADRLAATMRRVAASPRDVAALIEAGELSVRLDDASAAASLFARAEKLDPQNGRVKAGMGAILVRAERPGEALRYFNQAEGYGWPAIRFASDRGLAYDLLGEPERAQRDYRLALQSGADDETLRRYALSLAISGRRDPALEQLQPMIRRQDRGAWRTQAFVLALTGDAAGADKIATSMMPAAAAGLAPFFRRLPSLPAVDRAFAVHFGEVRAGPDRLADARLAPALAPLTAEADPFARRPQLAAVQAAPVATQPARQARQERRRGRRGATPVQTAAVAPTPSPTPTAGPVQVAAAASPPAYQAPLPQGPVFQAPAAVVQPLPAPDPVPVRRAPPVQVAAVEPRQATPVRDADSVLARIVASIKIPAAELEAAGATELAAGRREVARERADRAAAVRTIRAARPAAERAAAKQVASRAKAEEKAGAVKDEDARLEVASARAGKTPVKEDEPKEEVAAKPAKGSTRVAAKTAPKKPVRKETPAQRAAKAEPERIWVQVAGGANEDDLGKAWTGAKKQAAALSGRAAYTTKSRATNRVVTGPFKTDAEARAFVNKLRAQGLGAFSFTSDAGQKMAKLPPK